MSVVGANDSPRRFDRPEGQEGYVARLTSAAMAGAIIFCVAMVLVVPVGVMFAGGAWSALFGWLLGEDATQRAVGTPWECPPDE